MISLLYLFYKIYFKLWFLVINSDMQRGVTFSKLANVLEAFELTNKNYTIDELVTALPMNCFFQFTNNKTNQPNVSDAPEDYGIMEIHRGSSENYNSVLFYSSSVNTLWRYNRHSTVTSANGWVKLVSNADLGTGFVSSGAFTDIVQDGIYYISNNVIGKPGNAGGTYILASPYGEATTQCGLYIENLPNGGVYKIIRSGGDQQHIRIDQ